MKHSSKHCVNSILTGYGLSVLYHISDVNVDVVITKDKNSF